MASSVSSYTNPRSTTGPVNEGITVLAQVPLTGAYSTTANTFDLTALIASGKLPPMCNLDTLQRVEGYTSTGWALVFSKGTTLANGTFKLQAGGSEMANNTNTATSGLGGSNEIAHIRLTFFRPLF